jgi:hypothetical protein
MTFFLDTIVNIFGFYVIFLNFFGLVSEKIFLVLFRYFCNYFFLSKTPRFDLDLFKYNFGDSKRPVRFPVVDIHISF